MYVALSPAPPYARLRRLLTLALLTLVAGTSGAAAQPAPAPARAAPALRAAAPDSLRLPDTLAARDTVALRDTLATSGGPLPVLVLTDSAARALDSAAVAELADTSADRSASGHAGTPVFLLGREVFRVYGGLGTLSAAERARRLGERLTLLARGTTFDTDSLRIIAGATLTTLQVDDLIVMTVTEADASAQALTRDAAAARYAAKIRTEVARVRERSTGRVVLQHALMGAALLLLLVLVLWGLGRLFRWADLRLLQVLRRHLPTVTVQGVEVVRGAQIVRAGRLLLGFARLALSLLLVYVALTTVLGLFPWTQSWSRLLFGYLLSPVRALGSAFVSSLPDLLALGVIVVMIRLVIRGSNWLFNRVEEGTLTLPGFYPEFADPTRKIVRFLLVLLGILLAYPYTPIADSRVFQGLTVFLGLLFSLGSSSAIANMVAGTLLTYTRAFRVGDRVKVGDTDRRRDREDVSRDAPADAQKRRRRHPERARAGHADRQLFGDGPRRPRRDRPHHHHDWLRRAVGDRARAHGRRRAAHRGRGGRAAALRAPDRPRRLLGRLPTQRLHPPGLAPATRALRPAPAFAGHLRRGRHRDPLAHLRSPPRRLALHASPRRAPPAALMRFCGAAAARLREATDRPDRQQKGPGTWATAHDTQGFEREALPRTAKLSRASFGCSGGYTSKVARSSGPLITKLSRSGQTPRGLRRGV